MGLRCRTIVSAFAALLFHSTSAISADLAGQATVIDGDTIEIHGQRIRLHGIDAPESRQTCEAGGEEYRCGKDSAFALADYIGRQTVECEDRGRDRYDRMIAICFAGGKDVGSWMVNEGWALAYRKYSMDYVDEEAEASVSQRGMWRGQFVPPWEFRRQ